MRVTGVKLTRQGNDTIVLVEVSGRWVEIIREPFDGCFDHIVNKSGLQSRNKQDACERIHAFRREAAGHAEPLTCACCGEVSTNPGQFVKDGRWVCTDSCRKELADAQSYADHAASGGIVDAP
jgi:hypothetical protein